MEEYVTMRSEKLLWLIAALLVISVALPLPARGERVSLKFSYSTNNISGNDINTWVDSFNHGDGTATVALRTRDPMLVDEQRYIRLSVSRR